MVDLFMVFCKTVFLVFVLLIGAIFQIKVLTDFKFEDIDRGLKDANNFINEIAGFRLGWPKNIYDDCYNCNTIRFKAFPRFSDRKYKASSNKPVVSGETSNILFGS